MPVRIANGAGFLGDNLDAARRLVESAEIDFLTIEHLAELTLSILAAQRDKDPDAGFATDFLDILRSLIPAIAAQPQLHLIANSGGMNPHGCAASASRILAEAGLDEVRVGVVSGDDLLPNFDELLQSGWRPVHFDTGEPLGDLRRRVISANAYLGARPITDALAAGARIVITGRVADASLTVGPAMHVFGWDWLNCDRVAAATVAGHLIECGAQVTGGYSVAWRERNLTDVGYPIAELDADGGVIITKPASSGGIVSPQTVAEQLVYEIGDPRRYMTPDVVLDMTTVRLETVGENRVAVVGATGTAAPNDYKVSLAHRDGFAASGQLLVYGRDATERARACAEMLLARVERAGYRLQRTHVELLGSGAGVPGLGENSSDESARAPRAANESAVHELVLRIAVHDPRRDAVERFTKEFAPLITSGPAGLAGYATARSPVRPVMAYWPTRVPKSLVTPVVEVRPARTWRIR